MDGPLLLVVTGPPGAGKTTIAEALRERLGLPLLAKDTIKETLGAELGVTERSESHRLGGAVYELLGVLMHELLAARVSLICEGNFTARSRLFDDLPPARVLQLHVTAPPAVIRSRLLERGGARHPVHYDGRAADEIAARTAAGEWPPLPLGGQLVQIDTATWPALGPFLDSLPLCTVA